MMLPDPRPAELAHESHPELREERLSGESVYQGKLLHVHRDWVRAPDGHEQAFEYTLHPGAAAVIPILDDGRLVMERQWRYAMNWVRRTGYRLRSRDERCKTCKCE